MVHVQDEDRLGCNGVDAETSGERQPPLESTNSVGNQTTPNGISLHQSFPYKLHYMLYEVEMRDGLSHIVSWQPHGRCFLVHDKEAFVEQILGNWFRQSQYPSFQRQLNLYGFKRLSTGPDKGAYCHPLFLRQRLELTYRIPRLPIKNTGVRRGANPSSEPNFYAMPFLPPNNPRIPGAEWNALAGRILPASSGSSNGLGRVPLTAYLPQVVLGESANELHQQLFPGIHRANPVERVLAGVSAPADGTVDSSSDERQLIDDDELLVEFLMRGARFY